MSEAIRITLLVDQRAVNPDLVLEHGLSFLLEVDGRSVLYDTGASDAYLRNAKKLVLPLEKVDHVVLSHGHRDHTGGLGAALTCFPQAQVYLHPRALGPKFSRHRDHALHEIGFPRESWSAICPVMHSHVNWTTAPLRLAPGMGITGPIPRRHPEEVDSTLFFLDDEGRQQDPLEDDQALWIQTAQGLVVILGCTHAGVVNTLEHVLKVTGDRHIHAILGGLHLFQASDARLAFTAEAVARLGVERILPCHCTGEKATAFLASHLGNRVHPITAGEAISLESPV